jgi:alanine racemase
VSASAIARNAALALSRVPTGMRVRADLRHDAWGHGEGVVAAALRGAGIRTIVGQRASAQDGMSMDTEREVGIDLVTLYGLPGAAPGAVPAMRLSGSVLSVKILRAGEGVSYGYAYRATADSHVALVSGGYAQGIVRSLGNRVAVSLRGADAPIVGRVAMDVCVIDVGARPAARGDEVVYFGDPARGEPALEDWVAATRLSAAELVTAIGARSDRVVVA